MQNLDPINAWSTGAQMVALNAHHVDKEMLLNFGMFRRNGGGECGKCGV